MSEGKKIYLGTSGWKYDDWRGVLFPASCRDELAAYARRFDTVEIDSTWYHTPSRRVVESWRDRVGAGFRFSAKVPRAITHDALLTDCDMAFGEFLETMRHLGSALGPLLFQFPPTWTSGEGEAALRAWLPLLPRDVQFAMEFRHASWHKPQYHDLLRDYGVAWTLADFNRMPPLVATAPFSYIRWLGNRGETLEPLNEIKKDKHREEERWAQAISGFPVDEVWGYFNNHWAGYSPGSADAFKTRLGLPLKDEKEVTQQGTLF